MLSLTDETLEMHERAIGREFKKAERRHLDTFQQNGKAINEKVRLYAAVGRMLIEAKVKAVDPFAAIEKFMPWESFLASVEEGAKLACPEDFDYLALVGNGYPHIRRYAPKFLDAFEFRAAPASEDLLKAIQILRELNVNSTRACRKGYRSVLSGADGNRMSSKGMTSTDASMSSVCCPSCAMRCAQAIFGSQVVDNSETSRNICCRRRPSLP